MEKVLLRHGQPLRLPPKAFETLLALVEKEGHLVEKSELLNRVWPSTFVEEATLAQNIFVLRKALANGGNGHEYIETIPKRGYRFVGHVRDLNSPELSDINVAESRRTVWNPRNAATAAVATVLILAIGWFTWRSSRSPQFTAPSKAMLAVLPLVNLSGDPAQDYLCDGLTEQLLTDFGSLNPEGLGVIARTTMMGYKNTRKDVAQIGSELRVDYVLEGSLAREKERVRIDAQLIRVKDQTDVWAKTYERDLRGALALQDDVATGIANSVASMLAPSSKPRRTGKRVLDAGAYEAYLQGRFFLEQAVRSRSSKSDRILQRGDPQRSWLRASLFGPG